MTLRHLYLNQSRVQGALSEGSFHFEVLFKLYCPFYLLNEKMEFFTRVKLIFVFAKCAPLKNSNIFSLRMNDISAMLSAV